MSQYEEAFREALEMMDARSRVEAWLSDNDMPIPARLAEDTVIPAEAARVLALEFSSDVLKRVFAYFAEVHELSLPAGEVEVFLEDSDLIKMLKTLMRRFAQDDPFAKWFVDAGADKMFDICSRAQAASCEVLYDRIMLNDTLSSALEAVSEGDPDVLFMWVIQVTEQYHEAFVDAMASPLSTMSFRARTVNNENEPWSAHQVYREAEIEPDLFEQSGWTEELILEQTIDALLAA